MRDLDVPLRHCVLTLAAFLMVAIPFHLVGAGVHADVVLGGARVMTTLVGPPRVMVSTPNGRVEVDRAGAFEDFFRDPEQRPRPHALLVFWAWIAVAPLPSIRRRLRMAAYGTVMLVTVYALARACDASAWFHGSLVTLAAGRPPGVEQGGGVLGALGALLSIAALVVVPGALALATYPGFRTHREPRA